MVISSEGLDIDEEPSMKRQKGEIVVDVVAPSEEEKKEKEKEEIQSHAVDDGLDDDDEEEHTIDPAIEEELMQSTSMEVPLSSSSSAIKVSTSSMSPDLQVIPSSSSISSAIDDNNPMAGITFELVRNDDTDESNIRLIALKNIFSKQLPKMPKEYIVRLVFDHRHRSLAMIKNGRAIGGICYRPFDSQRFGEIVFCAISGTEQLKGYGSILMSRLKDHVQKEKLEYFLTYADNYAIGYFQRNGFSKHITMPKDRWVGYIKDYDGANLMECYIHPAVDYLKVRFMIDKQRAFIRQKIKERSDLNAAYDGLITGRGVHNLLEVPGVIEAGWTSFHLYKGCTERDRNITATKINQQLKSILEKVRTSRYSKSFMQPSSDAIFPGYSVKVKDPIDLPLVTLRLQSGNYYRTRDMMKADLLKMISNAKAYHIPLSEAVIDADGLLAEIERLFLDTI